MRGAIYLLGIIFLAGHANAQDDSFAGSFLSGKNIRSISIYFYAQNPPYITAFNSFNNFELETLILFCPLTLPQEMRARSLTYSSCIIGYQIQLVGWLVGSVWFGFV